VNKVRHFMNISHRKKKINKKFNLHDKMLEGAQFTVKCLVLTAAGMLFLADKPYHQGRILEGREAILGLSDGDEFENRRKIKKTVSYLSLRNYIKGQKREGGVLYTLTDEGRLRLFRIKIRHAPKLKGVEIIVHYDIPERHRDARDMLRWFLKQNGFVMRSKSCWAIDRDIIHFLYDFIDEHDLGDWVHVIVDRDSHRLQSQRWGKKKLSRKLYDRE